MVRWQGDDEQGGGGEPKLDNGQTGWVTELFLQSRVCTDYLYTYVPALKLPMEGRTSGKKGAEESKL